MNAVTTFDYSRYPQIFSTVSRKLRSIGLHTYIQDNPLTIMESGPIGESGIFLTVSKIYETLSDLFFCRLLWVSLAAVAVLLHPLPIPATACAVSKSYGISSVGSNLSTVALAKVDCRCRDFTSPLPAKKRLEDFLLEEAKEMGL